MRILLYIVLFIFVTFGVPVDAHQIKSDHGATVLLHVDPSDEPYSGTTTNMYLVFSQGNTIKPEECNCIAYVGPYSELDTIKETGKRYDLSELPRVMGGYDISHVFPLHDVYAIVLEGTPKEGATFEPFRIEYSLRVARGEELAPASIQEKIEKQLFNVPYVIPALVSAGILIIVGVTIWFARNRRKVGNTDS